jgi:hypothetical protein
MSPILKQLQTKALIHGIILAFMKTGLNQL